MLPVTCTARSFCICTGECAHLTPVSERYQVLFRAARAPPREPPAQSLKRCRLRMAMGFQPSLPRRNSSGSNFSACLPSQLAGVRFPPRGSCARSARLVLGVRRGGKVIGLSRVPLAPPRGNDLRVHPRIQIHHRCIRTPGPPQVDIPDTGCRLEAAIVKDETRVLPGVALALRRNEAFEVRVAADRRNGRRRPCRRQR